MGRVIDDRMEFQMSAMNRVADSVAQRIEHTTALDRLAAPLASAVSDRFGRTRLKDVLSGSWFGHPLHPLLTDLPIGSWTSAMVLDFVGGRRARPAADVLVAVGIATAVPTAVTGLSDWSDLGDVDRRTGLVHATANSIALTCYVASLVQRRRGRRAAGIMLGLAGASAATAGGFLGGHLVYRRGAGVDHTVFDAGSTDWIAVDDATAPAEGEMVVVTAGGVEVLVTRRHGTLCGLADRCSHQGGPLHEGELVDDRVRCPWHASEFVLADGSVAHGPASAPQPAYDVRDDGGVLQVRRRPRPAT
jgi:nitrite reductase/ring-hydroxylating ferredoxin subunit/uncharacterized membrane protein